MHRLLNSCYFSMEVNPRVPIIPSIRAKVVSAEVVVCWPHLKYEFDSLEAMALMSDRECKTRFHQVNRVILPL